MYDIDKLQNHINETLDINNKINIKTIPLTI